MKRREFIVSIAAASLGVFATADTPKVQSLDEAMKWLDKLDKAASAKTTGAWPMIAVLEHLAQSIEYSMIGFPAPKSALFQSTAGAAAFAFFKWRGQMSHSLVEPIPGAPALTQQGDWKAASARLRNAITRFNSYEGKLMPHFAYGNLNKAEFALAHSFHIANHQDEITVI
jgi:Protein of unknown function (DUF1569)